MNAKEILTETANLINTEGWVQGEYGDHKSGYCLLGALGATVTASGDDSSESAAQAYSMLMKLTGGDIAGYNDYPRRTKQQVLDLVHTAAAAV